MGKAGRSVLWFLGACMVFTDAVIGVVAKTSTTVTGDALLMFGFASLLAILAALVAMFIRNPAFITAEKGQLIPLELIQSIARTSDPGVLRHLITQIPASAWTTGESVAVEPDDDETEDLAEDTDVDDFDEMDPADLQWVKDELARLQPATHGDS